MRAAPLEMPYLDKNRYHAFVDPAGGGADAFTMAIGHVERKGRDDELMIVDVVRDRHGVPAEIVAEYSRLLRNYGVRRVTSDRYGGSWPSDEFRRHGITCEPSAKAKSDLYVDVLSALNSGRIELPPAEKLLNQFCNLERRTARGGRDSIDHPPGGHDDLANAVAGLAQETQRSRGGSFTATPIRGLV